jgi:hypothetical protein
VPQEFYDGGLAGIIASWPSKIRRSNLAHRKIERGRRKFSDQPLFIWPDSALLLRPKSEMDEELLKILAVGKKNNGRA